MAQKTKPFSFTLGRIKTKIWTNHSEKGDVWFNVDIVRLYLEGGKWQEATKFGRDDLPIVAKAADMAYAKIWEWQSTAPSDQEEQAEE